MSSSEDREVLQEVWAGRIPAMFTLSEQDCADTTPDPCYLMLPRMSYLPLATDKVRKQFSSHLSGQAGEMWFSYRGSPLRWHHPIGLLYDLLADQDSSLPWSITTHFSHFPTDQILSCQAREQVEAVFMASLKEADQLKHSGKVVSLMQKKDHNQLWLGLTSDKFDQFWAINRKLMEPLPGEDTFKHIPIRFYMAGNDNATSSNIVQRLVTPGSLAQPRLLGDLVREMGWEQARLVVQGVEPDRQVPLQWLARHLAYPDNFNHIAVYL
eukprot:GFUD01054748.1.p1 GENE.GFUD01054748.1~~GFUD01054748.1.p1  ORF type:complete len:268 (+),score=101.12 GFUD01054748.1:55-858(+)